MPKYSKFTNIDKKYFKRNYKDAIAKLIPTNYFVEDIAASGYTTDPLDEIINSQIVAAQNIQTLLSISAVGTLSSINSYSGITQYFVKQNEKTNITTYNFQRNILSKVNIKFSDYDTSADWKTFVDSELQPWFKLNNPTDRTSFNSVSSAFGTTPSGVHQYFANALGWLYFLNTSALSDGTTSPSSLVTQRLYDLYTGSGYDTLDGVNDFSEYVWKNYYVSPTLSAISNIMPVTFVSSTQTYTSGIQQLDKIKTLNGVLYSRLGTDYLDYKVRDEFDNFQLLSSVEGMTTGTVAAGPFHQFLQAMSYLLYDINDQAEGLVELYDIDNVESQYLPRLAELIGWEFIGDDTDKWRGQLREAARIYKAKGTKKGLDVALATLFGAGVYNLSGSLYELYESYIPFMIYYALATESPLFAKAGKYKESFQENYPYTVALQLGIAVSGDYSYNSVDTNLQFCVDNILLYLVKNFPESFNKGGAKFNLADPEFIFNYRGRDFPIPPYEEIKWYQDVEVQGPLLAALREKLSCFGISSSFLDKMFGYIQSHTCSGSDDDIDIQNSFIFYTSSVSSAPNFSTVLDDLGNLKAKYLSLWQGKSSHFDALFYAPDYTYSKYFANKDTNLGLQRALRIMDTLVPAHAIPRTKLIASFEESVAQTVYPCIYNNFLIKDLIIASGALNAYEVSGTNMGSTQLSSTGMSRFLVDSLEDTLINSNSTISAPRNNLRRRNLKYLLPNVTYYDRTGDNMPLSFYPSSLERSLPASGGGMELLGYDFSACEFTPYKVDIANENLLGGYGPQIHHPMNLLRDPTLSASYFLNGSGTEVSAEGRWQPRVNASGNGLRFGEDVVLDPQNKNYLRPIVFSGITTGALHSFFQTNSSNKNIHNMPGLAGWKDYTSYTLSYYIKNYNLPGMTPADLGYDYFSYNTVGLSEDPDYGSTKVEYKIPDGSTGLGYKTGMTAHIYWSDDKPHSKVVGIYYEGALGGFDPQDTYIEELNDGWVRISHSLFATHAASGTEGGTQSPILNTGGQNVAALCVEITPYWATQAQLTNAATTLPTDKLPTIGQYRGVYLWGIQVTEGTVAPPSIFTPMVSPVWYSCESLNSSGTFKAIETSNTFPCRGDPLYSLSSILDTGNCGLFTTRGNFPSIQKVMYDNFREKTKKEIQEIIPFVSGDFGVSTGHWFDQETSLENSSTLVFASSVKYSLHPDNLIKDPLFLKDKWSSIRVDIANTLDDSPIPTLFPKRFAKTELAPTYMFQNMSSGILSYQENSVSGNYYIYSLYVKNIDAPGMELAWKTLNDNPEQGIISPSVSWSNTTDASGTWIGILNPAYFDKHYPDTYGGTQISSIEPLTPIMVYSFIDPTDITSSATSGPVIYPMTDEISNNLARIYGPTTAQGSPPFVKKVLEYKFYKGQDISTASGEWVASHPVTSGWKLPVVCNNSDVIQFPGLGLFEASASKGADADIAYCSAIKNLDLDLAAQVSFASNKKFTSSGALDIGQDITDARWRANHFMPEVSGAADALGKWVGASGESWNAGPVFQSHTGKGPFVHTTTSALPRNFGYEKVTHDGWHRIWIKSQIGPQWKTSEDTYSVNSHIRSVEHNFMADPEPNLWIDRDPLVTPQGEASSAFLADSTAYMSNSASGTERLLGTLSALEGPSLSKWPPDGYSDMDNVSATTLAEDTEVLWLDEDPLTVPYENNFGGLVVGGEAYLSASAGATKLGTIIGLNGPSNYPSVGGWDPTPSGGPVSSIAKGLVQFTAPIPASSFASSIPYGAKIYNSRTGWPGVSGTAEGRMKFAADMAYDVVPGDLLYTSANAAEAAATVGLGDQFTFRILPAGVDNATTGSILAWGAMVHKVEANGITLLDVADADPELITKSYNQTWDDKVNYKFGQGIQNLYNDYTKLFYVHKTMPALLENKDGGPNIFSHAYGPLVYNGNLDVVGNENLTASTFDSNINIGENYISKNADQWQKSYTVSPPTVKVGSNVLPYSENFDPRVTTWQFGGSGTGAIAASAVYPPWGPMRWGRTANVSGPSSINSTPVTHQFIVQGKNLSNTWDWGSLEVPTPHVAEYMTSAQMFSMFVKKIDSNVNLTSTDSYVSNHQMTATDVAASSAYFGVNIMNLTQQYVSAFGYATPISTGSGVNAIEFAWSGVAAGISDNSAVGVCSVMGGLSGSNPTPSAITPSDCGNGWWRVGFVVSAAPSAVNMPVDTFTGGFTSGESGRWSKTHHIKSTRQIYIAPAGLGIQTVSSLTNSNYTGQYIWGVQLEDLNADQIQALNTTTTPTFSNLSSLYYPVKNTGQKAFDININGVPEYRDGSIISGIELVIPSGSEAPYSTNDFELSSVEVTSFDFDGVNYTSHPHSSYFKLFKIDPAQMVKYPNNPIIDKGCILVNSAGLRIPRIRIPLSNCRYPVYRRDYVDYGTSSYWPQSHLVGDVCSVQNASAGEASIDTTDTDEYLYQRATSATNQYHGFIYEPKPQVPFNTKTSNLLIPDHEYELKLDYTSFANDFVDKYGGGKLLVWIHTMPEEGEILRPYDQKLNIGNDGWVWSWVKREGWVKNKVSELQGTGGMDLLSTKLTHTIDIPYKTIPPAPSAIENSVWDPATICLAPEGDDKSGDKGPLRSLTPDSFYSTSIWFNTKNRIYNKEFRDLPLSFKNHPLGNRGALHRIPTGEGNFQYYTIEIFVLPTDNTQKVLFKNISIIDKTYESYVKNYKPENIPPILRFYDSITNSFVGTANASREKYTTSGTFEAQGGSRLNYRYLPSWGPVPATSGATGAISTIEFSEGKS